MRHSQRATLALFAAVSAAACMDLTVRPPADDVVPGDEITTWLLHNGQRIVNTAPIADDADLEQFSQMVGTARVIGAGETTHGTREIFEIKHRLFRALVKRHEASAFAIEASIGEALDIDRYVREGTGDPAALLANLH